MIEQRLFWAAEAFVSRFYYTRPRLHDAIWRALWAWAERRGVKLFDPAIVYGAINPDLKPLEFNW